METPPAYAPPKKSNTGLIIGLVLGGIAICCIGGVAVLFFGGLQLFKSTAPMVECMMNYTFVEKALEAYQQEHDGKLPSAASWQTDLAPYIAKDLPSNKKEAGPFKVMDPNGDWGCTDGKLKTGMAFNTEANGIAISKARADDMVIIFETPQTGRNLAMKYERLDKASGPKIMGSPRGWLTIQGGRGVLMDGQRASAGNDFKFEPGE